MKHDEEEAECVGMPELKKRAPNFFLFPLLFLLLFLTIPLLIRLEEGLPLILSDKLPTLTKSAFVCTSNEYSIYSINSNEYGINKH